MKVYISSGLSAIFVAILAVLLVGCGPKADAGPGPENAGSVDDEEEAEVVVEDVDDGDEDVDDGYIDEDDEDDEGYDEDEEEF